ncbi:hypothetical protein P3X46_004327 [Hevea brasiliensis]|uniref:Reverse transcriptase zinc-binding domain-containing protein n=1 Tax=Hevea brasiliensis TaxID=3981 RepID=A0ABQ9MYN2_HEVBR|nr:hypothetical protein P3X46_004327 [Hevea brasiliensis]
MAILKYPKSFCQDLNRKVSSFWWGKKDKERKMCLIGWKQASCPKFLGGMGFKDFEKFNLAYLAKQVWRLITNPSSLWAKITKGLYFPYSSIWQAKKSWRSSWVWNSLVAGREVLKEGIRYNIGHGTNNLIWEDPWIPLVRNFRVQRPQNCPLDVNLVSDLIDHDQLN